MCFHSQQSKSAQQLQARFDASFTEPENYHAGVYNGFQHPQTPIITNKEIGTIQLFNWGLIPSWAKDNTIRKNTLNARSETVEEKPAFRASVKNRCLVLADGFFEWQWLDPKGKVKQKYILTLPDNAAFAFAGLWSEWTDHVTGEVVGTYTIMTTEANALMAEIHNNKKRMPIILSPENEKLWLQGDTLEMDNDRLVATPYA